MQNSQDSVRIPWTIRIATAFFVISAVFSAGIFLLIVVYGFDGNFFRALINGFWILLAMAVAHVFTAYSLFKMRKLGWYAGLFLLGAVIVILAGMKSVGYVNFDDTYRFLALTNIPFLVFLSIGRKGYFATIEAKETGK
jgi:hypothetical protein